MPQHSPSNPPASPRVLSRSIHSVFSIPYSAFLLGLVALLPAATTPNRWQELSPGLHFMRWQVSRYDSIRHTGYCRLGEPDIALLRIDPKLYRFGVYHYQVFPRPEDQASPNLLNIEEWRSRLGALAAFNAGQYYPDLSYMGLLVNDTLRFSRKLHPQWQGIFAAEPTQSGLPRARIFDLRYNRFRTDSTPYTQLAQSFMLFDRTGKKRVKRGDWVANRTAVAEDDKGRVLIIVTEGGYTIWDFAQLLQKSRLKLTRAMSMDGGYESELSIRSGAFAYASYGQWETNDFGDISLPGIQAGLPAVIAVFRR